MLDNPAYDQLTGAQQLLAWLDSPGVCTDTTRWDLRARRRQARERDLTQKADRDNRLYHRSPEARAARYRHQQGGAWRTQPLPPEDDPASFWGHYTPGGKGRTH